jgi:YaiO family outer membrane protein
MISRIIRFIFLPLIFCALFSKCSFGQNRNDTTVVITDTTNLDALFKKARDLAYDNNYPQARRICMKILEKKPTYYDVRTFLGRIYAWEKQYDMARTELSRVLIEKENDYEALSALFDVEFWTESYSVANDYLKIALGYYPTSEELLLKKAKLQIKLEEKDDAALTLRRILDMSPGNKEAVKVMNTLEGRKLNNNLQLSYLVDMFDQNHKKPQQLFYAQIGRNFSFGQLIGRVNWADKFEQRGTQYELETYTHFTSSTYINAVVGYSDLSIFPEQKYTLELFQKLPKGYEISFGIRYIKFTEFSTSYTGSISNYYKDYYFSIRTFISPKTDETSSSLRLNKISNTFIGNIRRYFGDSDTFFGIKGGKGRSPEEEKALNLAAFFPSYQGGIEFQKRAFGRWIMKADLTYAKENINEELSTFTQRISTTLTMKTVF